MTDAPRLRVSTVIRRELTYRRDRWAVNELDEEFGRIWAAEYAWAAIPSTAHRMHHPSEPGEATNRKLELTAHYEFAWESLK
jgi:hypothetical protein